MAFNVGNFVKSTAKSSVEKMVNNVVKDIVSGLPGGSQLITSSTAQSLFNVGASYESISSAASAKIDNIISGGADEFFAMAGRVVNRTGGVSLAKLRRASNDSLNVFLKEINPTTKIAAKRSRNEIEILSAF